MIIICHIIYTKNINRDIKIGECGHYEYIWSDELREEDGTSIELSISTRTITKSIRYFNKVSIIGYLLVYIIIKINL